MAAALFGIPLLTATNAFVLMTCFQDSFFQVEFPQPTRKQMVDVAPPGWKTVYGSTTMRVNFDASEWYTAGPSAPEAYKALFYDDKQHCTLKMLVAVSRVSAALYNSDSYPGSITDAELVRATKYCGRAEMAKRGFEQVRHRFADTTGAHANLRIHVERGVARAKRYRMCDEEVKLEEVDLADKIFRTCFLVSNNFFAPATFLS